MIGPVNTEFLTYPRSVVIAILYVLSLIFIYSKANQWNWVRHTMDRTARLVALATLLIITIVFGLVRQDGSTTGICGLLGFTHMTTSWIFNILLFYFITTIALHTIHELANLRKQHPPIMMFHVAFTILLIVAVF